MLVRQGDRLHQSLTSRSLAALGASGHLRAHASAPPVSGSSGGAATAAPAGPVRFKAWQRHGLFLLLFCCAGAFTLHSTFWPHGAALARAQHPATDPATSEAGGAAAALAIPRLKRDRKLLPARLRSAAAGQLRGHGGTVSSTMASPDAVAAAPEVWARPHADPGSASVTQLRDMAGPAVLKGLGDLCGRCLYRTLNAYTKTYDFGAFTLVATGDIPAMWIRDSAVQIASYLPRVRRRPALRRVVEGAIRAQAYFILQDEYANAFNLSWTRPSLLAKVDRSLGRGGWVWTRNFELDSVGYFFNLLWNWFKSPGVWAPEQLLGEALVHDAAVTLLRTLKVEQRHEQLSPYRYSELAREGRGPPAANFTGMVWSAFRPSDDMHKYSYSIPDNMYVAGALERLLELNRRVWADPEVEQLAGELARDIVAGVNKFGTYEVLMPDGPGGANVTKRAYAYEVDGLGQQLTDFDDPNVPSLLAIPLLGYQHYDPEVYQVTRRRILSPANKYFYQGKKLKGLGSPHTPFHYIWPLATAVQALTSTDAREQAGLLKDLLIMASNNGLSHESVDVDDPEMLTRLEFGWANALTVAAVEQLLGVDCDDLAEVARQQHVSERERKDVSTLANRDDQQERASYYERAEANVHAVLPSDLPRQVVVVRAGGA